MAGERHVKVPKPSAKIIHETLTCDNIHESINVKANPLGYMNHVIKLPEEEPTFLLTM